MQPQQDENYWQPARETPVVDGGEAVASPAAPIHDDSISWQASESVHTENNGILFVVVMVVAVILLAGAAFIFRNWSFALLVIVMAVSVVVIGRRPPHINTYTVTPDGITINDRHLAFHEFRVFSVVADGAFFALRLVPTKRFMMTVMIYLPPESAEEIVDVFGTFLPMEHFEPSILDNLLGKIKF